MSDECILRSILPFWEQIYLDCVTVVGGPFKPLKKKMYLDEKLPNDGSFKTNLLLPYIFFRLDYTRFECSFSCFLAFELIEKVNFSFLNLFQFFFKITDFIICFFLADSIVKIFHSVFPNPPALATVRNWSSMGQRKTVSARVNAKRGRVCEMKVNYTRFGV